VELVPKIGVGIMGIHGNKMRLMYHTGKNSVKAGKTLGNLRENPILHYIPLESSIRC